MHTQSNIHIHAGITESSWDKDTIMTTRARPWKDKDWLTQKYITESRPMRDIAKEAGCHHSCISYWLARHGIRARGSERVLHQLKCPECGKIFNVTQTEINLGRTFCSHDCQARMMGRKKSVEHIIKKCLTCGREFEVRPSEINKKYCSRDCLHATHRAIYVCKYCGEEFVGQRSKKPRFCSSDCREKYRKEHIYITKTCKNCGSTFTISRYLIARNTGRTTGEFCTRECALEWLRGPNHPLYRRVEHVCKNCGKKFETQPCLRGKFCSVICAHQFMRGENASNWKGGISYHPYPPEFNTRFKIKIRRRDDYTCAICRLEGNAVHHINYVKNDTIPKNCITLCSHCHRKTNNNRGYWEYELASLMAKRGLREKLDIMRKWNLQTRLPGF